MHQTPMSPMLKLANFLFILANSKYSARLKRNYPSMPALIKQPILPPQILLSQSYFLSKTFTTIFIIFIATECCKSFCHWKFLLREEAVEGKFGSSPHTRKTHKSNLCMGSRNLKRFAKVSGTLWAA